MSATNRNTVILAVTVALLSTNACEKRCTSEVSLSLAEAVEFQKHNVATDEVSVPDGIGLELVDFGWSMRPEVGGREAHLEITEGHGRLFYYSATGAATDAVVEVAPDESGRRRLRAAVNLQPVGTRKLVPGWQEVRFEIPETVSRPGRNVLDLKVNKGESLKLRRVLLEPRTGERRSRGERPPLSVGTASGKPTVRMPADSVLDVVVQLPDEPTLRGDVSLLTGDGLPPGTVSFAVSLLDDQGREHSLAEQELFPDDPGKMTLAQDLEDWAGRAVRLRFSARGAGTESVRLLDPRITGCGQDPPCLAGPEPLGPEKPPKSGRLGRPGTIVVVLLDAARPDAFAAFGGPVPSPAMDRLAHSGTVFQRTLAPASWTGQSVPSLLTGLFPDTVGAEAFGSPLPDGIPTLAEILSQAGYRTVLWSQHRFYLSNRGLDRGFEESHYGATGEYGTIPHRAFFDGDDPLFVYIHFLPPHAPYEPPGPFRGFRTAWYQGTTEVTGKLLNSFPDRRSPETLDDESRRYIRERYYENVAFADHLLGQILDLLVASARFDDSLVVVLSDHGEAFLEHGRFLHTNGLYDELLRVPLVIKWPNGVTSHTPRVDSPVSLVDLVPTLVDGLSLSSSEMGFQGRTFLPSVFAELPEDRPHLSLTRGVANPARMPRPRFAIETRGWKAIYDPISDKTELYDLAADPGEERDLSHELPIRALGLRQAIARQLHLDTAWLETRPAPDAVAKEEDAETARQLEALGYL